MKNTSKLISLAVLFALYGQMALCCSSCDTKAAEERQITKAFPCTLPAPAPETEDAKPCPCTQPKPPKEDPKACPCTQPKPPKPEKSTKVTAEIAVGELADKITILEIKTEHITDPAKLKNIRTELETLLATYEQNVEKTPELRTLKKELLEINKQLWDIEDDIRDKEREKAFDDEFIALARSVYYTNDERCAVKRKINDLTGSRLVEEKSYSDYK